MRTRSTDEESMRTGNSRHDADDEQSYHTHFSAGSMGLAKRANKQLSLVGYVSMVEESDERRDESTTHPSPPVEIEDEYVDEPAVGDRHARTTPAKNTSPRRGYKTFQDYKQAASHSDTSFDHSSSTHKARGNTAYVSPMVSSSTSSSSHWRRAKPELYVITDVRDEEDTSEGGEIPMGKGRPTAEDLNDPTTPDSVTPNALDGAETRSRRRERLTRLARIKSPVRKQDASRSLSPINKDNETEKQLSPREEEESGRDRFLSPHHKDDSWTERTLSPDTRAASRDDLVPNRTLSPEKRINTRTSRMLSVTKNNENMAETVISLNREVQQNPEPRLLPYRKGAQEQRHSLSPSSRKDEHDHAISQESGLSLKSTFDSGSDKAQSSQKKIEMKPKSILSPKRNIDQQRLERSLSPNKKSRSPQDPSHPPKKSTRRGYGPSSSENTPRGNESLQKGINPEAVNELEDNASKAFMDKFLQKYHDKKKNAKSPQEYDEEETDNSTQGEINQITQYHQQPGEVSPVLGRQWPPGTTIVGRGLTPVREESRTSSSSAARSTDTLSDHSSVVTSHLQQGNPCISQFVQNTQFMTKGPDGTGCIGYTQKCSSFVSGVWQSCTKIGAYQTESKKSLLQLEMIAEQSVTTIFHQSAGGRQSPEAFRHSRELLAKTGSQDDHHHCIEAIRSDDATHENHQKLPFGGWNVEGALSSIGAKVQEAVGIKDDRRKDDQSMMDDMRHMFDSISTFYIAPHHQPYYNNEATQKENVFEYRHGATDDTQQENVFEYRHGATDGPKVDAMFSELSSNEDEEGTSLQTAQHPSDVVEDDENGHQDQDEMGLTSIYSSVARKSKDRRGMVMELQKRRMKQVKRKEDWGNPQKIEEETARLRRVYLGLYDKIHEEVPAPKEEIKSNYNPIQIEEIQDELEGKDDTDTKNEPNTEEIQEAREDIYSDNNEDARSENVEDDDDYAVVWAASEGSALSPRASAYPYQTESLVDHDSQEDEQNDDDEDDEQDDLAPVTEESCVPIASSSEDEPDPIPSMDVEYGFMAKQNTSKYARDQHQHPPSITEGEKSTSSSTRYLDAVEEFPTSLPSDEGGVSKVDSSEADELSKDGQQRRVPHPDPTFSSGDDETIDRDRCAPLFSSDTSNTSEDYPLVLPTVATGTTATSNEMEDLVSSFLEGNLTPSLSKRRSPVGMSDLRDFDGNSESSRPMVLLTQDMFNTVHSHEHNLLGNLHEEEEYNDDDDRGADEEEHDSHGPPTGQDCSYSIHSDPTLADSTMMSGYSGSNHTQDLSLAETIVSIGGHSRSTHRTFGSAGTGSDISSHDGTPEPSEVPPEIAQPLGPISEYQVLYQISEEDEEAIGSDHADDGSSTEEQSCDGSFEHSNDVPFDEDVTLEDYEKRRKSGRRFVSSLLRWTAISMAAYYLGLIGWVMDGSISWPTTTIVDVSDVSSSAGIWEENLPLRAIITTEESIASSVRVESSVLSSGTLVVPDSIISDVLTDLYLYDGVSVCKGTNGEAVCESLPFVTADSIPESESEAYRRIWALELQAALKDHN